MTKKIFFLLAIALILRLFKLNELFPFDFDQVAPAQAAYDFFTSGKLSLIGQELSFKGLFIGPLYNWLQFIPYRLCNFWPDCISYFAIGVGILTLTLLYIVAKKIFGNKIATISTFIFAVSFTQITFEIGINGNSFLLIGAIGLLYCSHKYYLGKEIFLAIGAFLAGLITVNFNPIFVFTSAAFFAGTFLRGEKYLQNYLKAIFAFLINFAPLVIFNFRHNNILFTSLENFVTQNSPSQNITDKPFYLFDQIILPFYSNFLFHSARSPFILLTLLLFVIGIYSLAKKKEKFYLFLIIWVAITFLGFTIYSGQIPDYYFQQTLLPFILIVSTLLARNFAIFLVFVTLLIFTNITSLINYDSKINYQIKKNAIDFIINDSSNRSFNVYYDFPPGLNTGYSYLFKARNREPQEGAELLYIIDFKNPEDFNFNKYEAAFKDKNIRIERFGYLHIVSVKY